MARNPTQASLDELFRSVTKLRIRKPEATYSHSLFESSAETDISTLQDCLRIEAKPDLHTTASVREILWVELLSGEVMAARLKLFTDMSLQWATSESKSTLVDSQKLGNWLLERGINVRRLERDLLLPTQASLDEMLRSVTRVRIIDGGVQSGRAMGNEVLLDTSEEPDIDALHSCFKIVEDPETFGHCMCFGDLAIELYAAEKCVATIGFHHGKSIRWSAWKWDALLVDGRQVLDWLAERGIPGPRESFETAQRFAEVWEQLRTRWKATMPSCLLPFWEQMMSLQGDHMLAFEAGGAGGSPAQQIADSTNVAVIAPFGAAWIPAGSPLPGQSTRTLDMSEFGKALEEALADPEERALAILGWYGQGAGPWTSYPAYETIAEEILKTFSPRVIFAALERHELTTAHLEGAARFLSGLGFRHMRVKIPRPLKKRLWAYVQKSGDEYKRQRAKGVFFTAI